MQNKVCSEGKQRSRFIHKAHTLYARCQVTPHICVLTGTGQSPRLLGWPNAARLLPFGKQLQDTDAKKGGSLETVGQWTDPPYQRVVGAIPRESREVWAKGCSSTGNYKGSPLTARVWYGPALPSHELSAGKPLTLRLAKPQLRFVWGALAPYLCAARPLVETRNGAVLLKVLSNSSPAWQLLPRSIWISPCSRGLVGAWLDYPRPPTRKGFL